MENKNKNNKPIIETSDQVYLLLLDILGFSKLVQNNSHSRLVDIFELLINTWSADLNLTNKYYLSKIDNKTTDELRSLFISDAIFVYSITADIENFLKNCSFITNYTCKFVRDGNAS